MSHHSDFLIITGFILIFSALFKPLLDKFNFPALLGALSLGLLINGGSSLNLYQIHSETRSSLEVLSQLGLMFLLFQVGIRSDLRTLLEQVRKALVLGTTNFLFSGLMAFLGAYYLLGSSLLTSLFVGIALSATSVGVTTGIWSDAGELNTKSGGLLIDMAELDDLFSIAAMIILFSITPMILKGETVALTGKIFTLGMGLLVRSAFLILLCFLFARFIEPRLSQTLVKIDPSKKTLVMVTIGVCCLISILSQKIGFSVAVGAFFAGLAYSTDPNEQNIEETTDFLYKIFSPFFFAGIALSVDLSLVMESFTQGLVLFGVAVFGKVAGVWLPCQFMGEKEDALLLGFSMIPRAEIALFVALTGLNTAGISFSKQTYGAIVFATLFTNLITPLAVQYLFKKRRNSHA